MDEENLFQVLGVPAENFWELLRDNYNSAEFGRPALGLMLYGDEAEALGTSWMTLNWSSEHCLFPANPSMSRFLITLFEKERYVLSRTNCNLTLQAVLQLVVKSFNTWSAQRIGGYYGVVTTIKGDWKWLRQALSLRRHYGTDRICYRCMASKSLQDPYTDLAATASWRGTHASEVPWSPDEAPELLRLHNFHVNIIGVDILHTFHLGLARDVIGSIMVILLRMPDFVDGRTIEQRIANASRQAKQYALNVAHRGFPRKWAFTKARLNLGKRNNYAEFHGKGWMAGVLLKWLNACFDEKGAPSDDLYALVSLPNDFIPLLFLAREQGNHLTTEQADQVMVLGEAWLRVYLRAHVHYKMLGMYAYRLFNPRPKMHMFHEMLLSCKGLRNPCVAMTWMDEDWLKRILCVTKKVHKKTAAQNTMLRWLAGLKGTLRDGLASRRRLNKISLLV